MSSLSHLLISVAHAVLALWAAMKSLFGWIATGLETILQPVMSPLLRILNPICTTMADVVYKLLDAFPPWFGLVLISAIAGVVMLVAFGYLSNQAGIARAKDDIKANLLALKLFKEDLRVALRAQVRIMWALLRLQRYMLVPILWMALPTMLLLSQMAMRYQWRPFVPGEPILLKVHCLDRPGVHADSTEYARSATIEVPGGLSVEVGPIAGQFDTAWRLNANQPGRFQLTIKSSPEVGTKEIVIGRPLERVSPVRPAKDWIQQLLYPVEPVISADGSLPKHSVELAYPELKSRIYGSDYWVLTFFVVSMLSALLFKPVFKIRF